MQSEPARLRACLQAAASASSASNLFCECIQGRFGEMAQHAVSSDASDLFRQAEAALSQLDLEIPQDHEQNAAFCVELARGWYCTLYGDAVVNAVAASLAHGHFFDEVLLLLGKTESRCLEILRTKVGAERLKRKSFRSHLFWHFFIMGVGKESLPAFAIVRAVDGKLFDTSPDVTNYIRQRLGDLEDLSPAQLYLLLTFIRWDSMPNEEDIPPIVRHCWSTGIYHLQLKMLDCVGNWGGRWGRDRSMSASTRQAVAEILSSLTTSNVMLSTQLVETMMVYDLIEPPVGMSEAEGQLKEILARPEDPEAQRAAHGAVSNIFEPLFEDAYYQAIDKLSSKDRTTLLIMAALALPPYSFSGDYVLSELLKEDDRNTLPAFLRFTRNLDDESCFPQEVAGNFMHGHVGCARYLDAPPRLEDLSSEDLCAWQCYGEIIFWSHKPGLASEEIADRCQPLWHRLTNELALASVDPLKRLAHANGSDCIRSRRDAIQRVFSLFRKPIRDILKNGMKQRAQLTSIDRRLASHFVSREMTTFLVHTLGQFGDAEAVTLLLPLVDDNYHGEAAVEAIRRINSGQPSDRVSVLRRIP